MIVFGFSVAMVIFFIIGVGSARYSKKEVGDYLVAGRSISPVAAGLSAVASNNSGFMFIGAIGFTYTYGLSAFWLFFAWIAGDYLSWWIVHQRLRRLSEERSTASVAGFLAHDGEQYDRPLQLLLGILTLIFLLLYAAAQLKAGGKALETIFDWSNRSGIFMGAAMVAAYSFAGGIRASIWTDVAQSIVMISAMLLLVLVCNQEIVEIFSLLDALTKIDPSLLLWTPKDASLGLFVYALGWFIAGFGGVGQPHLIVRAMTVQSEDAIPMMRRTYFSWYIVFSIFTMLVGLYARIYFEGKTDILFDTETALPLLASAHLAPILVGFILASLFAATMSTADSQVLASSASVTQDILHQQKDNYLASKIATIIIVLCAMIIALMGPASVFDLVTIAWGLMTTCFAPLMVIRVLSWQLGWQKYILTAALGMGAMLSWTHLFALGDAMYDGAVGFLVTMPLAILFARRGQAEE